MKLTAYPDRSIDTEKVRNAIKSQNQSEFFTVTEGGYLRAVNGGGKAGAGKESEGVRRDTQ